MTTLAWPWHRFQGSALALKFMRRDLPHLDAVIKLVPQRRMCLQAGGNIGIWPKRLAKSFTSVITCEPDPDNFKKLRRNAPEQNIRAYGVALGEQQSLVGLCRQRRDGKSTNHEGCVHVAGDGDVPMWTIDSFVLPVCDLIYLDVEGYELYAMRGAIDTLRRCRPVVALELHDRHLASYGVSSDDVVAFMTSVGYARGPKYGLDQVFLRCDE